MTAPVTNTRFIAPDDHKGGCPETAHDKRMIVGYVRASQLRRLATHRRAHGAPIDWEAFGFAVAKALRPDKTSRRWPLLTARDVLLGGQTHRLAQTIDEFEPEVVAAVQNGIDQANRSRWNGFIRYDDRSAKLLGIALDEYESLGLSHLPIAGLSPDDRALLVKEKRRARQRARLNAQPRAHYESNSIRARAEQLGIKPATLRKRISRARISNAGSAAQASSHVQTDK